jgi:hypothetical protein
VHRGELRAELGLRGRLGLEQARGRGVIPLQEEDVAGVGGDARAVVDASAPARTSPGRANARQRRAVALRWARRLSQDRRTIWYTFSKPVTPP